MTPHFTTACYVQADDKDKRNEVCDELERIGCGLGQAYIDMLDNMIITYPEVGSTFCAGSAGLFDEIDLKYRIDCGTNTELFLALASMRDDTDKGQWFTDGKVWILCDENDFIEQISNFYARQRFNVQSIRKATAAEIIEHFNKK